jgi:two-component system cell cycle response regulator DivK
LIARLKGGLFFKNTGINSGDTMLKVLYIEDDANNRLLVRRVLIDAQMEVLEASSAAQAMAVVKTITPDVILMDINMPEIDGYTLTVFFKSMPNLSKVPIIALTANVMRGDRERALEAGCDGYIQKPIDIDILPQQVQRFFEVAHE